MCKCDSCIFFEKNGYRDMGFSCDTCCLKFRFEELKKESGVDYNLFNSLLSNDKKNCKYYVDRKTYIDSIIKSYK